MQIIESLYALVLVIIFLLGSASVNAWTLLVRVDEQELNNPSRQE